MSPAPGWFKANEKAVMAIVDTMTDETLTPDARQAFAKDKAIVSLRTQLGALIQVMVAEGLSDDPRYRKIYRAAAGCNLATWQHDYRFNKQETSSL